MKYMMNFFMHVKVMLGGYFVLRGVEYPSTDLLFRFTFGINKPLKRFFTAFGSNKYLLIFIFISSISALFMEEQKNGLIVWSHVCQHLLNYNLSFIFPK